MPLSRYRSAPCPAGPICGSGRAATDPVAAAEVTHRDRIVRGLIRLHVAAARNFLEHDRSRHVVEQVPGDRAAAGRGADFDAQPRSRPLTSRRDWHSINAGFGEKSHVSLWVWSLLDCCSGNCSRAVLAHLHESRLFTVAEPSDLDSTGQYSVLLLPGVFGVAFAEAR
jgi:hypothetical protein